MFVENSPRAIWGMLLRGAVTDKAGCGSGVSERKYSDISLPTVEPTKIIVNAKRVLPVKICNSPPASNEKISVTKLPMPLRNPK